MIYFFYGDDTFSLLRAVSAAKAEFLKKHPQGVVEDVVVDGGEADMSLLMKLQESLTQTGLFEESTLVVFTDLSQHIKKFPKAEEYLVPLIESGLSKEKTLIIADTVSPDKRLKFYKTLKKHSETREFATPQGAELERWVRERLETEDFSMDQGGIKRMIELLGNNKDEEMYDLWQVQSELEKLMLYRWSEKKIEKEDVEALVRPNVSQNIFNLTNLFAEGEIREAVKLMEEMIGAVPTQDLKSKVILMVAALASQIRSLLLVKSFGKSSQEEVASELGWKPGRVWINQKLAGKFEEQKLKTMLRDLNSIDRRLKTSEEPPKLLLDLFIQKARVSK